MTPVRVVALIALLLTNSKALSENGAEACDKAATNVSRAIERLRDRRPQTQSYFDQAYAYAVFPSVTRIGLGFGAALGRGVVIKGNETIGVSAYRQFTSGIQVGARNFTMVLFFKDKRALELFQTGKVRLMGQAGIAFGPAGVAATPSYSDGIAIITVTRFGLMAELSISGAKFSYKPIATDQGNVESPCFDS